MSDRNGDLGQSTFTSLVLSLSSTAWIALGKIADPITGKIKKDLNGAKFSIDTLIMLRDKTKGNLTADEARLLNGVIADLQANYAETVFSSKEEQKKEASEEKSPKPKKEELKTEADRENGKVENKKKEDTSTKNERVKAKADSREPKGKKTGKEENAKSSDDKKEENK